MTEDQPTALDEEAARWIDRMTDGALGTTRVRGVARGPARRPGVRPADGGDGRRAPRHGAPGDAVHGP